MFDLPSIYINRIKIFITIIISIVVIYILSGNIVLNVFNIKNDTSRGFFYFVPNIQFGLDIVGGSQLLIKVDFDRFVEEKYGYIIDEIKSELQKQKVSYGFLKFNKEKKAIIITVFDNNYEKEISKIISSTDTNLAFSVVGGNIGVISFDPNYLENLRYKVTEESMSIIQKRIDSAGTKDVIIYRHGRDKIVLQVPGISDPGLLKRLLGKTAKLSFHLLDEKNPISKEVPHYIEFGMDILSGFSGKNETFYKIIKKPVLMGDTLVDARSIVDNMKIMVSFRFNNYGTKKFAEITREHVGKPLAIVLDGRVLSAPVINEPIIGGSGTISGNFSVEEAEELARFLKSGALPTKLDIIEERIMGPSIGHAAINSAKKAFGIGIGILMLFMIFYYRILGLIANFSIFLNLACTVSVMAILKLSITMPGIAAMILTLGMSVDANVLIYERMRDVIKNGKKRNIIVTISEGFSGSFGAIIDSNITTILSAVMLVAISSGFVRGFAISLIVGLLTSLFTAIVVTKVIIEFLARKNKLELYLN